MKSKNKIVDPDQIDLLDVIKETTLDEVTPEALPENLPKNNQAEIEEHFERSKDCFVCTGGSKNVFVDYDKEIDTYFVSCDNSKCDIEAESSDEDQAIDNWNHKQIILHESKQNEKSKEKES